MGSFHKFSIETKFFQVVVEKGESFLSYVILRGVGIIRDQFVWEKKLVIGCSQNWSKRC